MVLIMIRLTGRSSQKRIDEDASELKRQRLAKEARKLKEKQGKEREAKFPESKVWTKGHEKFAALIRSVDGAVNDSMPVDSAEDFAAAVIKRRSNRLKADDDDAVFAYAVVLGADTPERRMNIMEGGLQVTGRKKYKVTTSLFNASYDALGFGTTDSSKRARIANYALARKVTPDKLLEFVKNLGGVEGAVKIARESQFFFEGRVTVSVSVRTSERSGTLFDFINDEYVTAAWEAFKDLPAEKREKGYVADQAIVEAVMKDFARAKAKASEKAAKLKRREKT